MTNTTPQSDQELLAKAHYAIRHIRNTFSVQKEIVEETAENVAWLVDAERRRFAKDILQEIVRTSSGGGSWRRVILQEIDKLEAKGE